MLRLIGLGLDDGEITRKGMEALESSRKAYAEFYTNTETVDLDALEEDSGTEIVRLERSEVEQADRVLEAAREEDIAFLVSGDPLTATTHFDIKHRAEKKGIETEVFHAPSIMTSIAETGLYIYKFGRTVTLPEESNPGSIAEYIERNDSIGLHTLVLLDIDLDASTGSGKLLELVGDREAIVIERANLESMEMTRGKLSDLAEKTFGETPHSIVLTGEKSHKEEEFLSDI